MVEPKFAKFSITTNVSILCVCSRCVCVCVCVCSSRCVCVNLEYFQCSLVYLTDFSVDCVVATFESSHHVMWVSV